MCVIHPSIYLHLPEHHPLVPATRCQLLGVWTEADCFHTPLVTYKAAQDTARSGREPRPGCLARSPTQPTHPSKPADTWLLLRPTGGWCSHRRCWQRGGRRGRSGRTSQGLGGWPWSESGTTPTSGPPLGHPPISPVSSPTSLPSSLHHTPGIPGTPNPTQSVPIKCRHLPETP